MADNKGKTETKEEKVDNNNNNGEEGEQGEQNAEHAMHTLPPSVLDAMINATSTRYARIIVCSRLMTPHAKDKVGIHQQELIEKARINVEGQTMPVNGIAIVQSHSFINILEADRDVCLRYLNLLQAEANEEDLPWAMEDTKVVGHVEDCPEAQFLDWEYRVVSLQKETDIDLEVENVTSAASILLISLCKVGKSIMEKKGDKQNQMDKIGELYGDKLPSNERVLAFTEQDGIFSLTEYLEFFDTPIKVDLASEKVWPLNERMPY